MNIYSDKTLNEIDEVAMCGDMQAHKDGGVPELHLEVARQDGYLIYFFGLFCALNTFLQGVNRFDRPGLR